MSDSKSTFVYPKLCIAYFLEFTIWGCWAVALGGYAANVLQLPGSQIALLYMAIPLGAIISPLFIGPIADRYFAAQKILGVLHILSGMFLLLCGRCAKPGFSPAVLMALMVLHGICYMPTMSLLNTVVFKHIPNSANAPRVFVFGTLGWIAINLIVEIFFGGMASNHFFYVAAACSILLGFYSMSILPNTPPREAVEGEKRDALGLGALKMFRNPTFTIFLVCVFVASIPACGLYFLVTGPMLGQRGYPSPLALGTLNQFSEIVFMLALPFFASKFGLKKCLLMGMAAWCIRYFAFMSPLFPAALLGLLLHGFAYSFLYVAAYMYAEKVTPNSMKASVQSLMVFFLLGLGQVLGSFSGGYLIEWNPAAIKTMTVDQQLDSQEVEAFYNEYILPSEIAAELGDKIQKRESVALLPWEIEGGVWSYLDLAGTAKKLIYPPKDKNKAPEHIGFSIDKDNNGQITWDELHALPQEGLTYGTITYSKANIEDAFKNVAKWKNRGKDVANSDIKISRTDWLGVQSIGWTGVFFPAILVIAICFVFFAILGKDPIEIKEEDLKS